MEESFVADVPDCPRCENDHEDVTFYVMDNPAGENNEWTHWGECPITGDPILRGVWDDEDPPGSHS